MKNSQKEKAFEIFNKCCDYADYTDENCCFTERETMYKNGKALALIVIDELLLFLSLQIGFYDEKAVEYFTQVKQKIEEIEICENNVFKLPKKYTEKHLEYAYEQGLKSNNPCYYRSFENVLSILKNKK